MLKQTFEVCRRVKVKRTVQGAFNSLVEEVGELSTEINIDSGYKQREPGPDGIIGESIDVILSAIDVIWVELERYNPYGLNNDEAIIGYLEKYAAQKLKKWEDKYSNREVK